MASSFDGVRVVFFSPVSIWRGCYWVGIYTAVYSYEEVASETGRSLGPGRGEPEFGQVRNMVFLSERVLVVILRGAAR
jgi:hypothetical protein